MNQKPHEPEPRAVKPGLKSTETYSTATIVVTLMGLAATTESSGLAIACVIVAGLVGLGFAFLRTSIKSWLIVLTASALLAAGCSTPTAINEIGPDGPVAKGSPVSMASMDNDGLQTGSYQGAAPTNIKQDATGAWITTPGQGGATVLTLPNGISAYIWSPKDGKVGSIKVSSNAEPGGFELEILGLEFNITEHAKVVSSMYAAAMTAIEGMTKIEAERRLGEMQIAGEITASVAEAAIKAFVPAPG